MANKTYANEIVAIIGDKEIVTSEELDENIKIDIMLHNPKLLNNPEAIEFFREHTLNSLITNKMFMLHSKSNKDDFAQLDITQELEVIRRSMKCTSNLDMCLKKHHIGYKYLYERIRMNTIQQIIIASSLRTKEASEIEILKTLLDMHKPDTPENRNMAKNIIFSRKMQAQSETMKALLRKIYYIEVLH